MSPDRSGLIGAGVTGRRGLRRVSAWPRRPGSEIIQAVTIREDFDVRPTGTDPAAAAKLAGQGERRNRVSRLAEFAGLGVPRLAGRLLGRLGVEGVPIAGPGETVVKAVEDDLHRKTSGWVFRRPLPASDKR